MTNDPHPTRTPPPREDRPELLTDRRRDLAARAAWLYHAKGLRQDEIARALALSRQMVQRLIALAATERLIRFQLVHPLAAAIELADRLTGRFALDYCEIVPSTDDDAGNVASIASAAAFLLEGLLDSTDPVTVGIGGRRVIREAALRVAPTSRPMHRLVSLMGNMTRGGRAGHYDVIMGFAERVGAQCFPLPVPVVTGTVEERRVLQAQPAFLACRTLVAEAALLMTGIGPVHDTAPLLLDGFITPEELASAQRAGAVGDILGNCFDGAGKLVDCLHHDRLTSFPPEPRPGQRAVIVQCGAERVPALHAALTGRLANGLITDENTARALLDFGDGSGKKPIKREKRNVGDRDHRPAD